MLDALGRVETAVEGRSGRARPLARKLADALADLGHDDLARNLRNATRWGLDNLAACARNTARVLEVRLEVAGDL